MAGQGRPKTGGRVAGTPNKGTAEFREAVTRLLKDNAENIALWLSQVAEDDPGKALDKICQLAEFATPKLARSESHVSHIDGVTHEEWLDGLK